ncbi:hypothetical protein [Diaphorobacter aerolatus]|uniref:Uncharacterized protein n=1 Tax=Diaphorobacter aerolatus TaxID=1288495 RepID=A0A7H0GJE4_9BURK|nr:hypothetical protein [Diaphorobacter aerolatus]QNP48410.1 hypothetical protein H9K75_21045 [Diaphorobacter aerolatus]
MNEKVIEELLSELETVTQLEVEYDYASYKFYMAGKDSTLSQNTELRFNEVYGHCDSLDDVQTVLNRSDICLVLSYENRTPIAFFGEVEGNHGDAQARASYWKYRPRLSVFSIGRSQGGGKNAFIYTSNHDGIPEYTLNLNKGTM